ncbi:MAG: hypothetical protein EOO24_63240, partial [Comamonadaceae bacterium]
MNDPDHFTTFVGNLPAWWWAVLALCLAGIALLRGLVRERPNAARELALDALIAQGGPAETSAEQDALDRIREAARATRQRATQGSGGLRALYRTPWYVFLGDRAADVPKLLSAARDSVPLDTTGTWQWRALRSMIAIGAEPDVIEAPDALSTQRAWCHALLALAQERGRLPLNGVVVCVDAHRLRQEHAVVAADATRLRRCVDQIASQLQLRLPVYVVVTGLEALDGFDTVRSALPTDVLAQAVGHRLHSDRRTSAHEVIDALFTRLHTLRMALLRARPAAADRHAVHLFIEGLRATESGLHVLATQL